MKPQRLFLPGLISLMFLFNSSLLQGQWQFSGSPETGHPIHYAYSSDRIYMIATAGLFYSTDQGNSWNNIPLPDSIISVNRVYEENGSLFLMNIYIWPDNDFYPAAYRSDDGGQTWKSIYPFNSDSFNSFIALARGDTTILVQRDKIAISTNQGESYEIHNNSLYDIDILFFHSNQLMASTYNGLYASDDLGKTWEAIYERPDSISSLIFFSNGPRLIRVEDNTYSMTTKNYIFISDDNGLTWNLTFTIDDPFLNWYGLYGDSSHLFLVNTIFGNKLYHSDDGGTDWEVITLDEHYDSYQYIKGLLFGLRDGNQSGGVRISYDQGLSFQEHNNGFIAADCDQILYSSSQLWVHANSKVYRNENTDQWSLFATCTQLVSDDGTHLLAYINGLLQKSDDGGLSWDTIPASLFQGSPFYYGSLYACGGLFFLSSLEETWYSADFGITWDRFTFITFGGITAVSYSESIYIIATSEGTILRSLDGLTWENISFNLDPTYPFGISMVHILNGYTFARLDDFGNIRLSPGDQHWKFYPVINPNPVAYPLRPEINALIHSANVLFGSIYGHGVFVSLDNGGSWLPFNHGLNDLEALTIEIMNDSLYLGVSGGVWTRPVSDLQNYAYSGVVYNDMNENGVQDPVEPGIKNVTVRKHLEDISITTLTDGSYKLYSYTILPDTISADLPSPYAVITTPPVYITEPDSQLTIGIHFTPGIFDNAVTLTNVSVLRPGFETDFVITYKNKGTETSDMPIKLSLPDELEFVSASIQPSFMGDTLNWQVADVPMLETGNIVVRARVNASTPIGTILNIYAKVMINQNGDYNPENNVDELLLTVLGSYDPNEKSVFPSGYITPSMIADTQRLEYTIRFQNTGNYPASFVRIQDTLSSYLDLSSLELLASSHPFTWKLLPQNVLDVYFENINLPDSSADERSSHGFVRFAINAKPTLHLADQIENKAYIYFDFNAPVITNTVGSTVGFETRIRDPFEKLSLSASPVPTKDFVLININSTRNYDNVLLTLYDSKGSFVKSQTSAKPENIHLDMHDLPSGIYLLQARTSAATGMIKVIKY